MLHRFLVAFATAVVTGSGLSSAAELQVCAAFLGQPAKDGRPPKLTIRQRIPVEIDGYVSTQPQISENELNVHWNAPGAYAEKDPLRPERVFYHPGYRQGSYKLFLSARSPGSQKPCTASMDIDVDVDFTQYLEVRAGSRRSGRIMDEFTQFWMPLYISIAGSRTNGRSESDVESRLAVKLFDPRIYIGVGNRHFADAADGISATGWGFGIERVPDIDRSFSVAWYVWRYPSMRIATISNRLQITSYCLEFTQLLPRDRHFIGIGININHFGGVPALQGGAIMPFIAFGWRT